MPEWKLIEAGQHSAAVAGLTVKRNFYLEDLDGRLADMAVVLEEVTPQIEALIP